MPARSLPSSDAIIVVRRPCRNTWHLWGTWAGRGGCERLALRASPTMLTMGQRAPVCTFTYQRVEGLKRLFRLVLLHKGDRDNDCDCLAGGRERCGVVEK